MSSNPLSLQTTTPAFVQTDQSRPEISGVEPELSLGFYAQLLIHRLPSIVAMGVFGGLAAFCMQLGLTPLFRSTAVVAIQPQAFAASTLPGKWQDAGGLGDGDSQLDTNKRMLQSRSLRAEVIDRLQAEQDLKIESRPSILATLLQDYGIDLRPATPTVEEALSMAASSLTVKASTGSRVIDLSCESPDPDVSARFLNTLISVFKERQLDAQLAATTEARNWLAAQVDQVRNQLQNSERQLQGYADDANLTFTDSNQTSTIDRLRRLQEELVIAQVGRAEKEARWLAAANAKDPDGVLAGENANLQAYQMHLSDLERELASLRTTFTPAHAKVRAVQAQIDSTREALERARHKELSKVEYDYRESVGREKSIQTQLDRLLETVGSDARKKIHYDILRRDVEANQALFQEMLLRAKELGVSSALNASSLQVIDAGTPARNPYKPEVLRNVLLGIVSGAFLAIGFVFIRVQLDPTVRAPGEGAAALHVPELGAIPRESTAAGMQRDLLGPILNVNSPRQSNVVELATFRQKPSPIAESFRAAMASMLFVSRTRAQVIVVTSAGSGDGKSTLVSNLGIALAETGRRVLVIDGDMRAPRLHRVFDLANTWGLSQLLDETSSIALEDAPREALARETSIPNLFLLPSGPPSVSSSHLLFTPRVGQMLTRLRRDFSLILIDTPPAGKFPDARALAREADGAVVVVRAASSHKRDVRAVIEQFWNDNTKVLGTILNDWDPRKSRSTHHYGYRPYGDI